SNVAASSEHDATSNVPLIIRYQPGQPIAKRGQIIDGQIKAALDQLEQKAALARDLRLVQTPQPKAGRVVSRGKRIALAGALIVLVALLVALLLHKRSRQAVETLLPATVPDHGFALHAETRERLLPHLARLMVDSLVQRLLSQRAQAMYTQRKAVADLAELE